MKYQAKHKAALILMLIYGVLNFIGIFYYLGYVNGFPSWITSLRFFTFLAYIICFISLSLLKGINVYIKRAKIAIILSLVVAPFTMASYYIYTDWSMVLYDGLNYSATLLEYICLIYIFAALNDLIAQTKIPYSQKTNKTIIIVYGASIILYYIFQIMIEIDAIIAKYSLYSLIYYSSLFVSAAALISTIFLFVRYLRLYIKAKKGGYLKNA